MTKTELVALLETSDSDYSHAAWMRMTKRELELVVEARTAPSVEASQAAYQELLKIERERGAREDVRKAGVIKR